ncbi:DUF6894 family protein [Neorhizobium alkalisoli]|uniref:DUF6894 domain-containing protein n=1 Tax=Neorhizobium alkalisoli TaxID=528178 RepID=A0A561QAZ6_9HYPH|nr:hypothetical protein FHW37_11136 [Neorhizobium alkalisoli]
MDITRYYFHMRDGQRYQEDPEGTECADPQAAHDEAVAAAREILALKVRNGELGQVFEITDEAGTIVERLPLKSVLNMERRPNAAKCPATRVAKLNLRKTPLQIATLTRQH